MSQLTASGVNKPLQISLEFGSCLALFNIIKSMLLIFQTVTLGSAVVTSMCGGVAIGALLGTSLRGPSNYPVLFCSLAVLDPRVGHMHHARNFSIYLSSVIPIDSSTGISPVHVGLLMLSIHSIDERF